MKRASFLLQTARLDRELTLEEICKKTKISLRYLQAFESENICELPDEPYCSLMLREYATFLGLKADEIVSIFRRDYAKKVCQNTKKTSFISFTPQFTYIAAISVLIIAFASYLFSEYVKFNRPPNLIVSWPETISKVIEIKGNTDIESTVKINQNLVIVDQNGNFTKKLDISSSEAKIIVESVSPSGKSTVQEKIIK